MVRLTSVAVAALLAGPALAAPFHVPHAEHAGHAHTHEARSDIEAHEPRIHTSTAALDAAGATIPSIHQARDLEELALREPFLKKVLGVAKKVVGGAAKVAAGALSARELEELEELALREPFLKKVLRVAKKVAGGAAKVAVGALSARELEELEELAAREFDDLEEREPIFGILKVAKKVAKVAAGALSSREVEELEEIAARDPRVGSTHDMPRGGQRARLAVMRREPELEDLSERDLEELEELALREPFLKKVLGAAKKVVGGAAKVAAGALAARDLETIDELMERAYFDAEFDQLD
ncbi:unnamed protein product [Cyclocybe aegerita]|uniref:Uncharacterized protein n=1 Tax=Cyclocybe aegerita TaxID=1973307 RepID=A0A8S0XKD1_CYCAE|nr:unnamed protein product [Cyclocybe aegerita]